MSDETDRLEAELEVAKLADAAEQLREAAYASGASPEDKAAFREAIDKVAAVRRAFKERFAPAAPGPGDASPTPEPVRASTTVKGKGKGEN